jgi:hypothetical protein
MWAETNTQFLSEARKPKYKTGSRASFAQNRAGAEPQVAEFRKTAKS